MMTWIKRLFGVLDRTDAASERIALAMEGMATDIEAARGMLRDRLGIDGNEASLPAPALPAAEEPARRNGKKVTS